MKSQAWQNLVARFGSEDAAREYQREYQRKRRLDPATRAKAAEIRRRRGKKRPTGDMWKSRLCLKARARGRMNGLEATIRRADLHWPTTCPVLGIPLVYETKEPVPGMVSLDRWDNSKGYVPGNVRVISFRANALKNNATIEELEKILLYMQLGDVL